MLVKARGYHVKMGRIRRGRKVLPTAASLYLAHHRNLCHRIFIRNLSLAPLAYFPDPVPPNSDFHALLTSMRKLKAKLIVGITLCGILLLLAATPLVNYRLLSVVSSSMEPTIQPGAIIAVSQAAANLLAPGDIFTFHLDDILITHRIIDVGFDGDFYYTAKGDANQKPDPYRIRRGDVFGKVVYITPPKLATFLLFLRSLNFSYALFFLPIAYILYHGTRKILPPKKISRRNVQMVSWLCTHCNKRMYSAYDSREKITIDCLYCDTSIINPYYQKSLSLATEHKPSPAKAYYK